ncbi:tyrosine-type recombinase/integrase [Variovorax dokdonensis]|uniref:Tyrosine-type recombinase/integrase n=1 Tax=Variovorax dokdonensis TaxID=344883 RepID=A0ABT7NAU5_9BURK|nr:integrase arm-type DNA-binding domain-containing protein [Variovorax dokdonensis]MDM0045010.1 tyrosine-type recombinase/integrase [Variovorax dokdonensis]
MARNLIGGDRTIRALKPGAKRLSDGEGLYLLPFFKGGAHGWRLDYTFAGRRNTLSLGTYPAVGLKAAREAAVKCREMVASGVDPSDLRKKAKVAKVQATEDRRRAAVGEPASGSFEDVALRWHQTRMCDWSPGHATRVLQRLKRDVFPFLGGEPIGEIDAPGVLKVLRRIEARGVMETTHRALENCFAVFAFAIAEGAIQSNPATGLKRALKPVIPKRYAAVTTPEELAPMLRAMDGYKGTNVVRGALKLLPMMTVRPGELRFATWDEFDLEGGWWRIPPARMKGSRERKLNGAPHWVPLPVQARHVLEELRSVTGHSRYVFPSERSKERPMSENTINMAFRTLGYPSDVVTGHGFRATARTIMDQVLHVDPMVLEVQLAHKVPGPLADCYNRSDYREFRAVAMQLWADYLDALRKGEGDTFVARCRAPIAARRINIENVAALNE